MSARTFTWSFAVGRDYAEFLTRVREFVARQVMSETDAAHREIELTEMNATLERTWLSWVEMPLDSRQVITLIAHFHYVDERVESIEFEAGDPRPQEVHADTHTVTGTVPPRRAREPGAAPTGGAGGAPRPNRPLGDFLSSLDVRLQELGAAAGILELFGLAAFEVIGAGAACLGSPIAILAGLHAVGSAQYFRHQVAYYRGYVLAIADLSQARSPNDRAVGDTWFNRGRAEAIRYVNESGRDGVLMLTRLHMDHANGQAVVNYLWADIISSRISSEGERGLARTLRPVF